MKTIEVMTSGFWRWIDRVAEDMLTLVARVLTPRCVQLIEREAGHFSPAVTDGAGGWRGVELGIEDGVIVGKPPSQVEAALRGSRVELLLRPDQFVFKPLDLPLRAAEFLDGVVRAQIDRLTPWSAEQAAFGVSKPADAGPGRIAVTVAATAKGALAPLLKAFASLGVRSLMLSVPSPEGAAKEVAITVLEKTIGGVLDLRMARRILVIVLAACGMIAATAIVAATIINANLQARQDQLARRIAERRAAMITARNTPGDPAAAAERALARRKNEAPAAVIALEVLSQILPDHTYVTELRIEGDKLRLSGVTHDAPELIRLIEQTRHFTQATFFAPVTRSPSDSGDRFNIEARIEPNFSLTP